MNHYDEKEQCPKCHGRLELREWIPFSQPQLRIGDEEGILIAKCNECGYRVERLPLDAKAKATP